MTTLLISQIILLVLAFALGASLASFLCVVVERGARKEPITGKSHCACGRELKWYENVPVIGWLAIGGKTKCCQTRLPPWYLISEVAAGLVTATVVFFLIF